MPNRTFDLPSVFAVDANTVIPAFPTPGSGYRKEPITALDIQNGWQYSETVDSSIHNETMFIVTSLLQQIAQQGNLSWCATTTYVKGAKVLGSDGNEYKAVIANLNVDPVTAPVSTWKAVTGKHPGEFVGFAMNAAPSGFLVCDGSAVSRTLYPDLFAAIGITWGLGDGGTTFNLPDARGEFFRGFDSGAGIDSGRSFAVTQTDALKAHNHYYATNAGVTGSYTVDKAIEESSTNPAPGTYPNYGSSMTGGTETRPRNITQLVCIAI